MLSMILPSTVMASYGFNLYLSFSSIWNYFYCIWGGQYFFDFYVFLFGCAGSSLLHGLLSSCNLQASHFSGFSCCGAQALACEGFSSCSMWAQQLRLPGSRAQAQQLWCTGLAAVQHVGSSRTRVQIHVSCIARQILYH